MISGLTILPFKPNWARGITLRSTFATSQRIESTGGLITRTSGRDYGQRQIRFTLLPDQGSRRQWDAFRELNPPGTVLGVPLWSEQGIVLTADVASGATALHVNSTASIDWRSEGVIFSAFPTGSPQALTVEGFEIQSVSGNTLTLSAPISTSFSAGDEVLPLMRARQLADYAEDLLTPETSEIELTFDEVLDFMSAVQFPTTPTYPSYLGLPVLPLIAEWSQPPKITITTGIHYLASGLNTEALATLRNYVRQHISHRVGMDGPTDRALLWQFFHDRQGRFNRFWLPALKDELKLSADVSSTDTTFQLLNDSQFASRFSLGGDLRRAIFITDGFNYWIRQIINLSGGSNRVTINSAVASALRADSTQIGLLTLVQFATDDIVIELEAPVVATATLSFTELEMEYAEVIIGESGAAAGTRTGQELVAA